MEPEYSVATTKLSKTSEGFLLFHYLTDVYSCSVDLRTCEESHFYSCHKKGKVAIDNRCQNNSVTTEKQIKSE